MTATAIPHPISRTLPAIMFLRRCYLVASRATLPDRIYVGHGIGTSGIRRAHKPFAGVLARTPSHNPSSLGLVRDYSGRFSPQTSSTGGRDLMAYKKVTARMRGGPGVRSITSVPIITCIFFFSSQLEPARPTRPGNAHWSETRRPLGSHIPIT
jgi:hypothetical protein